jgi:hypothetical protein
LTRARSWTALAALGAGTITLGMGTLVSPGHSAGTLLQAASGHEVEVPDALIDDLRRPYGYRRRAALGRRGGVL